MKNKIDKMLRDRPIKDKLNLVFRMVTISFLLLVASFAVMLFTENIHTLTSTDITTLKSMVSFFILN